MRLVSVLPLLLLCLATAAPAGASPSSPTTAAVSIGDSYISGEAGRWQGNSVSALPGNDGTDRGETQAYGTSGSCHRSDVAEIRSASLAVAERINIACSGAVTKNIFRAASGGEGQNGEAPQADQLGPIARDKNVKFIMLSIGGNDLGFASIVSACLQTYVSQQGPCEPKQQPLIDAKVPKARADVGKAIDEIRTVMSAAGYGAGDYRLVLQTYPSVIPRAAETRYMEAGPERTAHGCPFYDQDLTWARDRASKQIGAMVRSAAADKGTEILDLGDAFQSHEFCSKSTQEASLTAAPSPTTSDWGRFVGGSTVQQGQLQEAFHPNAYGQRAFGACVSLVFAQAPGVFSCFNRGAGQPPESMSLSRSAAVAGGGGGAGGTGTGTGAAGGGGSAGGSTPASTPKPATGSKPRLRLSARRLADRRHGRSACLRFTVTSAGKPVSRARVILVGRSVRTTSRGRASTCVNTRAGSRTARAYRTGFRSARLKVKLAARR